MKIRLLIILSIMGIQGAYATIAVVPSSMFPASTQPACYVLENAGSLASDIVKSLNQVQNILSMVIPVIDAIGQSGIARDPQNNVGKAVQQYKDYIVAKAKSASTGGRRSQTSNVALQQPEYQQTKQALSMNELALFTTIETTANKLQNMFPLMGGVNKIVTDFLDLTYLACTTVPPKPPYSNIPTGGPLPQ